MKLGGCVGRIGVTEGEKWGRMNIAKIPYSHVLNSQGINKILF